MIGRTISHYKIKEKIGAGGMGVVYLAHDSRLNRPVALKFLSPQALGDETEKQRLIREARNAAALSHPNICTIYEIDEADDHTFIAMAYLEGRTIARQVRDARPTVAEAIGIARQLAEGLKAAHAQGIVHRDIKSDNVIISQDGSVRILDFGLSEACCQPHLREDGKVAGTPSTMAPETLRGESVDQRVDIWAWGVVLYQLLTGRLPFSEKDRRLLTQSILESDPLPPSQLNPDVPSLLDAVVMKALAKQVGDRFQNMSEVIASLDAIGTDMTAGGLADTELEPTVELDVNRPRESIAVLSFADMSEHKDQQYFCDGIADEIINHLSRVPGLHVASRTSSFSWKDQPTDVREIGRQLGVETVLEGSVRKAGNQLRINCQLVGVAHGYHLWSRQYDRTLNDVFSTQEEIAKNVVGALRLELSDAEKNILGKAATRDLEAFDFYLRGREFFYSARRKTMHFALEMFRHATERDPGYSRAYAGIADCHSWLFMHFGGQPEDLEKALAASQKAIQLDPELAEGHAAYGFALSLAGRADEAEREFAAAIGLNPNLFEAYYLYARMCFAQGKLSRAAELFEAACEVCPAGYQAPILLAQTCKTMGQHEKANALYATGLRKAELHLDLHPDDPRAHYLSAHAWAELGDRRKALQVARRALEIDPDDAALIYGMACLSAQLGHGEQALDFLERAIRAGFRHRDWIENDSDLDPVAGDPRFERLLATLQPGDGNGSAGPGPLPG
jgi:serine/threonine protein kinase/Flp pilus assembly protein TadD